MLSPDRTNKVSLQNEEVAEKRFKKIGYSVERLDKQGHRKRPEFLVLENKKPLLICEVKTIFSAGYSHKNKAHISTEDPDLINSGQFREEIDFTVIENNLSNAISKYRCLINDYPLLSRVPLVVVFFLDFFAEIIFELYPKDDLKRFPEISGILKIESNRAIRKVCENISLDDLKQIINTNSMRGLPPNSKEFLLIENKGANTKLPRHFVESCVTNS